MDHHEEREGIGAEDLPAVNRALFDHALRAALRARDPRRDFEGFVEALWQQLAAAFEWQPQEWPQDLTTPPIDAPEME